MLPVRWGSSSLGFPEYGMVSLDAVLSDLKVFHLISLTPKILTELSCVFSSPSLSRHIFPFRNHQFNPACGGWPSYPQQSPRNRFNVAQDSRGRGRGTGLRVPPFNLLYTKKERISTAMTSAQISPLSALFDKHAIMNLLHF